MDAILMFDERVMEFIEEVKLCGIIWNLIVMENQKISDMRMSYIATHLVEI
jgi:hypothetical protein